MANSFTGKIIRIDTVNAGSSYTSTDDAKYGGSAYSTSKYVIKKIQVVDGANTNAISLKQFSVDSAGTPTVGSAILTRTLATGELEPDIDMKNTPVDGLIATTLGGSTKLDIFIK